MSDDLDPITFELLRHRLVAINDEATFTIMQVSANQIATDSNDLNSALMTAGGEVVVRFFSPVPGFAQRYLELVGVPLPDEPRCLFAFGVPDGALPDLEHMLSDLLWLKAQLQTGT